MERIVWGPVSAVLAYLDSLAKAIEKELQEPRTQRNAKRVRAFRTALQRIPDARAALYKCPDGAALAIAVLNVVLSRYAPAVEVAERTYRAQLKGAERTKTKRYRHPPHHTKIRAFAKKLDPDLPPAEKIGAIQTLYPFSRRQIERILNPPKKTKKVDIDATQG